jgi:hypothetical protein
VTYDLETADGSTRLALIQDSNATQEEADRMAQDSWAPVLEALKVIAEEGPRR